MAPVAFVGLAHAKDARYFYDHSAFVVSNQGFLLKIEPTSGRILEARIFSEEDQGSISLRFEAGLFERVVRHNDELSATDRNLYDAAKPFSSFLVFAGEELIQSSYLERYFLQGVSRDGRAFLAGALEGLLAKDVWSPLNRLIDPGDNASEEEERFVIPHLLGPLENVNSGVVSLVAGFLLLRSGDMFARDSWPWILAHESGLVLTGKTKYSEQALKSVYESTRTGPLGYLAAAKLLGRLKSPLAPVFATKGLERLSTADFRRDCHLLLGGEFVFAQCVRRLAEALRQSDESEVQILARLLSTSGAESFLHLVQSLREGKDRPLGETITTALDEYWDKELKQKVERELRRLGAYGSEAGEVAEMFNEGLKYYQGEGAVRNYAEAVGKFRQAAQRGHAGAQFILGQCYEEGTGVTKDFGEAMKWYRQAAENGLADAQLTLGQIYSDAISPSKDDVEAFVWFTVAAGQGNKTAETLRDSVLRKLTPEQAAEGRKRAANLSTRTSSSNTNSLVKEPKNTP